MRRRKLVIFAAVGCVLAAGLVACGNGNRKTADSAADTAKVAPPQPKFHADNDIAMVVRSLVDAVEVGEKLDSTVYNYRGVLTDGQGKPIYLDTETNPGLWEVKVQSAGRATLANVSDGDMRAAELAQYVVSCLPFGEERLTSAHVQGLAGDCRVYALKKGRLTFTGPAPEGLDGCRVIIEVSGEQ